jgi:hypothetical protein
MTRVIAERRANARAKPGALPEIRQLKEAPTATGSLDWSGMVPCGSGYDDDHSNVSAPAPGGGTYIAMVVRNGGDEFSHYAVNYVRPGKGDRFESLGTATTRDAAKQIARQHADMASESPPASMAAETRSDTVKSAPTEGKPADPQEVAGLVGALHTGLSALDPVIDRIIDIGLFAFWDAIQSDAARKRFAHALDGACRLARIQDGAPEKAA